MVKHHETNKVTDIIVWKGAENHNSGELPEDDGQLKNKEDINGKGGHAEYNSLDTKNLSDNTNIEAGALTVYEKEPNLLGNNLENIAITVYNEEDNLAASKHLEELAPGEEAEGGQRSPKQKDQIRDSQEDDSVEQNIQYLSREGDLSPRQINNLRSESKKKTPRVIPLQVTTRCSRVPPQRYSP